MKYITFTVPCYNSQDYMARCIESLLPGGDDVEIIIVNDGSKDATGEIADYYEKLYPGIVRAVHKENGGHGSGVNAGLKLATGMYFKVVDSDDWLDESAYAKMLERIREFCVRKETRLIGDVPDLFVCNYIYDHLDEGTGRTMRYTNVFPVEEMCSWNDIGRFHASQYLIMHALVFRTEVLRRSGVVLPEHTFYVDNIFAYQPLPFVEHIFYMDIDLYHYYIGREDQSVNEKVLMSRIDQQIRVTKMVATAADLEKLSQTQPKLARYLTRNISIMMSISCIHLLLIGTPKAKQKREALWHYIRAHNRKLYHILKYKTLCGFTYLPGGRLGDAVTIGGYRAAKRIYQFN